MTASSSSSSFPAETGGDGRPHLQRLSGWPVGLRRLFLEYREEARERFGSFVLSLLRPLPRAIALGLLEGFVIVVRGLPVGLVTSNCHRGVVRIGFLHVLRDWRRQGLEQRLLTAVLLDPREAVRTDATAVSEAMVVSHPDPDALFTGVGFTVVPRWLMKARLGPSAPVRTARGRSAAGTVVRGWQAGDLRGCAEVLSDANSGTVDGMIYPELLDAARAVPAVQGILTGTFGRFLRRASSVAVLEGPRHPEGPEVCGISLCSRTAPGEAFLIELAVRRSRQGGGLGTALIERSLSQLSLAGLTSVVLGVTRTNVPALSIYRKHGFEVSGEFSSYYLAERRRTDHAGYAASGYSGP